MQIQVFTLNSHFFCMDISSYKNPFSSNFDEWMFLYLYDLEKDML